MSAIPLVVPADLRGTRSRVRPATAWSVRTLGFAALALYGAERWGRLERGAPQSRLLGLVALAVGVAVLVPAARRLLKGVSPALARWGSAALAVVLCLAAFPLSGLRWEWVVHLRVAVCAREVGRGLGALPDVLLPYLGHDPATRLVMMLGAAILLLDGAVALATAPRAMSDGRRAVATLPLIALAIVPAVLVPTGDPVAQGLILFGLVGWFQWGERVAADGIGAALALAVAAGVVGAVVGPIVSPRGAWVDYRAWTGSTPVAVAERFDWNQTYGPLHWPQDGHVVFTVRARTGEYWKAEDLTRFTGSAWVAAPRTSAASLPAPSAAVRRRYTEPVTVRIGALRTRDVIGGAGESSAPRLAGGVAPGAVPGTWVAATTLGAGTTYTVDAYSPTPSARALRADAATYPWAALAPDLDLELPVGPGGAEREVAFPAFHRPVAAATRAAIAASPYRDAFALARRLADAAPTPAAFVAAVQAHLDSGAFSYSQQTAPARFPLVAFLDTTHVGYCQQFSGAMALLERMGGVPARVAAGFTTGAANARAGTFAVADLDAHAWVETWFPRYGWVRFDPTPSSAPARGGSVAKASTGTEPALHPHVALAHHSETRTTPLGSSSRLPYSVAVGGGHGHRRGPAAHGGRGRAGAATWPWIAAGVAALLAVASLVALAAVAARRRGGGPRRRGAAVDPVSELTRALRRTGHASGGGLTLVALERRLAHAPEAAGYVRALRGARYGASATPPRAGRAALRSALAAGGGVRGRLRALWALPPRLPHRPHA